MQPLPGHYSDMHMNNMKDSEFPNARKLLLALAGILIVLSYGSVTTRGGYADDFAFLAYSSTHTYIDAILGWSSTFNSRISQGVMMPLLLKGLGGDAPGNMHWAAIHVAALLALVISVFLLYRIMQLFLLPWQASIAAILIFSLNPIKSEALMWPATIVGYIIPLCVFLFSTWFFFRNAKHQTETAARLIISALLFVFCLFAIEQLFPLFILVVAMRLVFFNTSRQQLIYSISGTLLISAIYLLVTFSGKTTERMDPFMDINTTSIISHTMYVLRSSLTDLIGHTPRILIDPYFHSDLIEAGQSVVFMLAILTIAAAMVILYRHLNNAGKPAMHTEKRLLLLFSTGILIYLATLSPFMVLSYYIAARALYIPSLGIALMAGAVFAFLAIRAKHRWQNIVLAGSLAMLMVVFVLVNLFSQNDFSRQWSLEQDIIDYVSSIKEDIPENTELSIFNVPKTYGPSPGFVNRFGFNGIVNWIHPGKSLYGETQNDFSDVLRIPETIGHTNNMKIQAAQERWVLAWTPAGIMRITGLNLSSAPNNETTVAGKAHAEQSGLETTPGDLYGVVSTPGQSAVYSDGTLVTIKTLIHLPQIDAALLQILVTGEEVNNEQLRLILHARNTDNLVQPYDMKVSLRNGFQPGASGYSKYFLVSDISSIKALHVSLTSKRDNLSLRSEQHSANSHGTSKIYAPKETQTQETPGIIFF